MNRKGIISTADNLIKRARVTFPDNDSSVSYELLVAEHIGELTPGNIVLVAFWNDNMTDGAVIAELR